MNQQLDQQLTAALTSIGPGPIVEFGGRFYIKMFRPGFNSPANNRNGYASAGRAYAAFLRYSNKGAR